MPLAKCNDLYQKITITLDTNCIIDIGKDEYIDKLIGFEKQGLIEIHKTDVVDTELQNTSAINKSANFEEDLGFGIVDHSRIGFTRIGGDETKSFFDMLLHLVFPETKGQTATKNQIRDIMHIIVHRDHNRDYFVTKDNDFINKSEILDKDYKIVVVTPKRCVELFNEE